MAREHLFTGMQLGGEFVHDIRRMNPWWEGTALPVLPEYPRLLVQTIQRRLEQRLAPIVVVRGPRQVGKTTAQLHLIEQFLKQGIDPKRILRVQCDDLPSLSDCAEPILRVVDWYEDAILGRTLNDTARAGLPAYLFFDEVQNLKDWAPQLKSLVDSVTAQVVVTGSSALRIERQGRDSLAGRISTVEAGVLSLTEIGMLAGLGLTAPYLADNGLEPLTRKDFWTGLVEHGNRSVDVRNRAFALFSARGGYPLAHRQANVPWDHVADQLNETIVRRVIQHDLRLGERGRQRDEALLEEIFRLSCRYIGQSPGPDVMARETKRALSGNVGPRRIRRYLRFLGDTLLVRLIEPLEIRLKRRRGHPKICLADHGLRAAWLREVVPIDPDGLEREPHMATLAGHIAESVVGATLSSVSGLAVAHVPERRDQPEVDFVLTVGTRRIPLEVKYRRRIDPLRDTEAMRTFIETTVNNAPFGILVTLTDVAPMDDPRIVAVPLSTLMMIR